MLALVNCEFLLYWLNLIVAYYYQLKVSKITFILKYHFKLRD